MVHTPLPLEGPPPLTENVPFRDGLFETTDTADLELQGDDGSEEGRRKPAA